MKARYVISVFLVTIFISSGCTTNDTFSHEVVEAEAKAFYEGYAEDLLKGDSTALRSRYHSDGTYLLGGGFLEFISSDSLKYKHYGANNWSAPEEFEWHEMSYEALSNDVVSVVGKFSWERGVLSYSGIIARDDDGLKLKLENYSGNQVLAVCRALENSESRLANAFSEKNVNAEDVYSVLCPGS